MAGAAAIVHAPDRRARPACGQRRLAACGAPLVAVAASGARVQPVFAQVMTLSAPTPLSNDSFSCRRTLTVNGKEYVYYALPDAEKNGLAGISRLPFSMKVLLENLLRFEDERSVTRADIQAIAAWPD